MGHRELLRLSFCMREASAHVLSSNSPSGEAHVLTLRSAQRKKRTHMRRWNREKSWKSRSCPVSQPASPATGDGHNSPVTAMRLPRISNAKDISCVWRAASSWWIPLVRHRCPAFLVSCARTITISSIAAYGKPKGPLLN